MATKNSLVKQAELVPQLDQQSLAVALSQLQDELSFVSQWKAKAESLEVSDARSFTVAGDFRSQVRAARKVPRFKLEPFEEVAKRVSQFLEGKRTEAEAQFDAIDLILSGKMDAQATRERMAAEAEQRRINDEKRIREEKEAAERRREAEKQAEADRKQREKEIAEARKAGELNKRETEKALKETFERAQRDREGAAREEAEANANFKPVEVKPNLPTIQGSRRHRNFRATFVNFPALLEAWRQARNQGSMDRAAYLSGFITADEQALNREARAVQDSRKLETMIPGIVGFDEDKT
jgi:G3E family GTPase